MAARLFSSSVSTILNTTNKFQINKTKSERWILGMIIGSAPFLFIVICWIFVSFCTNNLTKYYLYTKKQGRYAPRKNIKKNPTQTDTV